MAESVEAEVGSAMWHRKVHHEVEVAVNHALNETGQLDQGALTALVHSRIDKEIKKAVAKMATPERVEMVIRKAFTRSASSRSGYGHVEFGAPAALQGVVNNVILEEFRKKFKVTLEAIPED